MAQTTPERSTIDLRVISPREASKLTSLSRTTLWRMAQSGTLEPIRLTERRIGYRLSDLESFLNRAR